MIDTITFEKTRHNYMYLNINTDYGYKVLQQVTLS